MQPPTLSGVLVVALILGNLRRSGGMNWTIPLSANLVLRNFGLSIFLGQVAIASGRPFVETVASQGASVLLAALAVLVTLVATVLLSLVLGACGWHPRGVQELPEGIRELRLQHLHAPPRQPVDLQ